MNPSEVIEARRRDPGKSVRTLLLYAIVALVVFSAVYFVNGQVFACFVVEGTSMEPNVHDGDVVFVNRLASPKIGDVIVVRAREGSEPYIKRVYGLGGDTVGCENGVVYRIYIDKSGEKRRQEFPDDPSTADFGPVPVPKNGIFFLGDNRTVSDDSRYIGAVPLSRVIGVVTPFSLRHKEFFTKLFGSRRIGIWQ